jgi:WD40 repeat protein
MLSDTKLTEPPAKVLPCPLGPNVSTEEENLFQSDHQLLQAKIKRDKQTHWKDKGNPLNVSSKILSIQLSPFASDELLVGESGFGLRILDLSERKDLGLLKGHSGPVTCALPLFWAGKKCVLTGSWDKTIKLWDYDSRSFLKTLEGHSDFVKSLVLGTNTNASTSQQQQLLFSASTDATIRVWDLDSGKTLHTLKGHRRGVEALVLDLDGRFLYSGSSDRTIKKWDLSTLACVETWEGHLTSIYDLSINENYLFSGKFFLSFTLNKMRLTCP